jgi:hypothetical protein
MKDSELFKRPGWVDGLVLLICQQQVMGDVQVCT